MVKAFREVHTTNQELSAAQRNISTFAQQFYGIQLLGGILVRDVTLSTATTAIAHKLGRTPIGYIVVDKNTTCDIWTVAKDATTLTLDTSAAVTATLWVF